MLTIKLEVGDREIGRMQITATAADADPFGAYDVTLLSGDTVTYRRSVTGWPRRRGAWALLREALRGVRFGDGG